MNSLLINLYELSDIVYFLKKRKNIYKLTNN